ncbi:hypothetical protein LCGC14_2335290 [marine sediment metagenome]|uniref:Uncharacterized protein n=1 Tax=marine sediment metagenome TaxID=412755 RepID=A0A0F9CDK9_9ZZZZ
MGILGDIQLVKRTREVTIGVSTKGKEIKVTVTAPPLQLSSDLRSQIVDPKPPILLNDNNQPRFKTNPRSGEPIKENGQLVPMLDTKNADYLVEAMSVTKARTLAMIFHCTEFPGAFDTKKNGMSPVGYELARWKELEKAGLDVGVFAELSEACVDLALPMTKTEIEDARRALGTDKETQERVKEALGKKAPKGK